MTFEILKLRQNKIKDLNIIRKLLLNSTQLTEYQSQLLTDNTEPLPSNGFIHVDKDHHFFFETEPAVNTTQLTTQINDNFFYQHMFNFALVVILLLQVLVVWAFIWCRLSKYSNQIDQATLQHNEEGLAMRDMGNGELPELIPQHYDEQEEQDDNEHGGIFAQDRCARFG